MKLARSCTWFAVLLMLAGCSMPARMDGDSSGFDYRPVGGRGGAAGAARSAVHTELIQTMLAQHQYYAALAHIQQLANEEGATPELRYLEGEVRRKLGQSPAAEALYRGLLRDQDYSGAAYHGLGLLAAERGDVRGAVQHLRTAAGRRPTDAEIRNDLGYALMLSGRYQEALPEIATAVELDPANDRSRSNLLLLLMLQRDEKRVRQVVAESGVKPDQLARLRAQAQSLSRKPAGKERVR